MQIKAKLLGRWLAASLSALLLSACLEPTVSYRKIGAGVAPESVPKTGEYVVQAGDTLYSIAFRHELDYRDIASWNGISDPYIIQVGQRLRLQMQQPAVASSAASSTSSSNSSPNNSSTAQSSSSINTAATGAANPDNGQLTMSTAEPVRQVVGASAETPATANQTLNQGPKLESLPPSNVPVLTTSNTANAQAATAPTNAQAGPASTSASSTSASSSGSSKPLTPSVASTTPVPPPGSVPSIVNNPPRATPAAGSAGKGGWSWPAAGKVISTFSAADPTRQGIDIAGNSGDAVLAARTGEVVYSGRGIIGFGELIVIKHDDSTLTAYGHNRKRLVKEGDKVSGGQQIAEMGKDLRGRDLLHFEVRRNGKPIDPKLVLSGR